MTRTIQTMEEMRGWESKTMIRLFRFKRYKDEAWVTYHTRACNIARKMWKRMVFSRSNDTNSRQYVASHGIGM